MDQTQTMRHNHWVEVSHYIGRAPITKSVAELQLKAFDSCRFHVQKTQSLLGSIPS